MVTKTNIPKFKMIKSNPRDFWICFKIFEENMKETIEKHWGWKPEIFEQNFNTREIRLIEISNSLKKSSNEIIGFFQIKYKKDLTYINQIQILKEFQNKGFGTQILKIIQKEAKEKNLPKLQLQVFQDNPAIQLYEKFGFRITKKLDSTYIMEL